MGVTLSYSGLGGKVKFSGTSGRFKTVYINRLLLDFYPSAAGAYSLRKLSSTYTGNAIRVRRSSDNTETNIGFVNGQLDTASLLTFCGAGSGFVTTWYDQSGNARNTVQATTANQPIIVLAGSIYNINSKPAILFNGSSTELRTATIASWLTATPYTFILVDRVNTIKSDNYFCGTAGASGLTDRAIIAGYRSSSQVTLAHYFDDANFSFTQAQQQKLHNIYFKFPNSEYFINNTSLGTQTNPANGANITDGGFQIGRAYGDGALNYNGYLQEVITYASNQLTNRTGINTNINSFYSIYTPQWSGNGTALLDLYPSAAGAYSLRNLSSTYLGPLIRVRRSSDNAEQDIYGTISGTIDTVGLLNFVGVGNGFISKWYDQSGNSRDLVQVTTTMQPKIVNSGTIYTTNGKPSVYLLGGKVDFPTGFLNGATNVSLQMVINIDNGATDNIGLFGPQTTYNSGIEILSLSNFGNRTALRLNGTLRNANSAEEYQLWNDNSQTLTEIYANTSSTSAFKNNASVTLTNSTATPTLNFNGVYDVGQYGGALAALNNGYLQEFVIYTNNQVANRTGINTNINSYYSIY